jgi:predicted transcriptional regulator
MSTLTIRLPDDKHLRLRELARRRSMYAVRRLANVTNDAAAKGRPPQSTDQVGARKLIN